MDWKEDDRETICAEYVYANLYGKDGSLSEYRINLKSKNISVTSKGLWVTLSEALPACQDYAIVVKRSRTHQQYRNQQGVLAILYPVCMLVSSPSYNCAFLSDAVCQVYCTVYHTLHVDHLLSTFCS